MSHRMLFISCCCLWFGLSLVLAAPALPWIVAAKLHDTTALSAFYSIGCFEPFDWASSPPAWGEQVCTYYSLLPVRRYWTTEDKGYVQSGVALGVIAYVAALGMLLPCALMTSVAVCRMQKLARYGTPPYISGCSPASLHVAQCLGWPAFSVLAVAFFCSLALCSTATAKLNANNYNLQAQWLLMPGSVAAGLGVALLLLGLALQASVARALRAVHGVGCNSGGCCRLCGCCSMTGDAAVASASEESTRV